MSQYDGCFAYCSSVLQRYCLYFVATPVTLDNNLKFLSHFSRTLYGKLDMKLQFNSTTYPQKDGQAEVMNQTLENLHSCFMGKNVKQWELILSQVEFAYMISQSVYRLQPFRDSSWAEFYHALQAASIWPDFFKPVQHQPPSYVSVNLFEA